MIDVKQAVDSAKKYAAQLLGDQYFTTLEEVELSEDGPWWLVTLGFHSPTTLGGVKSAFGLPSTPIFYKLFEINRESGEVRSMKIRQVG